MRYDYSVGISTFEAAAIASMLSGKLRIKIKAEEGKGWSYNFDDKTIYYDPRDLEILTETDVVANLLHEAGHAKYSTQHSKLKHAGVPEGHFDKLWLLSNALEDNRMEDVVRHEYPYASDYIPLDNFKTRAVLNQWKAHYDETGKKEPRFVQYVKSIYSEMNGISMPSPVSSYVDKTKDAALRTRTQPSHQALMDIICKEIYPHIKDLLDEYEKPNIQVGVMITGDSARNKFPTYKELYHQIRPLIAPTITTFSKVLKNTNFDRFSGKHRSGQKLNERKLYKFRIPDFRLFQRKEIAATKNYVFSLVVDESGSMNGGNKSVNAVKSAILFAHVLEKMGIPYGIYGFNAILRTYKKPEEPLTVKIEKDFEGMMKHTTSEKYGAEDNNDGMAIYTFGKDMMKYDKKKVMFVLSDGAPAETQEGRNFPLLGTVARVTKQGIDIVGIGIQSEAVKDYYENNCVVDKVDELPSALLSKLKKALTTGTL